MGIYLSGGQHATATATELWGRFLAEVRAGESPVAAVLAAGPEAAAIARAVIAEAGRAGAREGELIAVAAGESGFALADLAEAGAVILAGEAGDTPALRRALSPIEGELRRRAAADAPFLGVSAGARLVAEKAIVGGWQIGGVPVCPRPAGGALEEVTVEQGLGLLDLSIDVAPAAEGTLGRLVAATEAGLVDGGIAVDRDTVLVVAGGRLDVIGTGSLWQAVAGEHGVAVSTRGA